MHERSENLKFADESLNDFLDSLALSESERQFIKDRCVDPVVAMEVKGVWHNLECWGEDCQDSAVEQLRDLIKRIKTPQTP